MISSCHLVWQCPLLFGDWSTVCSGWPHLCMAESQAPAFHSGGKVSHASSEEVERVHCLQGRSSPRSWPDSSMNLCSLGHSAACHSSILDISADLDHRRCWACSVNGPDFRQARMVWGLSGVGAQWCGGSVVWGLSGVGAQWCGGSVVWGLSGVGAQWCGGSVVWGLSGVGAGQGRAGQGRAGR